MAEQIKPLLDLLFKGRDSVFIAVEGFNQEGKTDFVLHICEEAYNYGYFKRFGFNQELENTPFEWDFISDYQTLEQRLATYGKKYLFFLDELGKTAPRSMPWNKMNLELIKKLEVKRKDKLSLIGASIGDVDRRIISPNYLDVHIRKTSLTTATINHLQKRVQIHIKNIPPTSIKFKEFTVAEFTLEPVSQAHPDYDRDVRLAVEWSQGVKYAGDLAKPNFYKAVKRGISKLLKLSKLPSNATMQEEEPLPEGN